MFEWLAIIAICFVSISRPQSESGVSVSTRTLPSLRPAAREPSPTRLG
jgi:hypothetical protein